MFFIDTIRFEHFKNYESANFSLCPQVNCFVGNNGAGKTNVLDAIYYASFTKSFFTNSDQQQINQITGSNFFSIEALVDRNQLKENVRITYQHGLKKTVKVNNNEHKKMSDHIGLYPLVMIAPIDILLILEGSEERRKFMDGFISQFDKEYLNQLMSYNRVMEQRNRQLKIFAEQQQVDNTLLQTYNEQLIDYGTFVYIKRKHFMEQFTAVFKSVYKLISGALEEVDLIYQSTLHLQSMDELLRENQQYDLLVQRTTKGIHKDDLQFRLNHDLLKKFGSQGQQKSFIIALKLAQYNYLKNKTGTKPLLLLDDIFEKLDEQRLSALLSMIAQEDFGQLFITDTHLQRLQEVFKRIPQVMVKYFLVDNGTINEI